MTRLLGDRARCAHVVLSHIGPNIDGLYILECSGCGWYSEQLPNGDLPNDRPTHTLLTFPPRDMN